MKRNSPITKELKRWENKYKKLQQVFRLQEEIIATYEAAYGEAPGLIEEEVQVKESEGNSSFFKMMEKRSIIASIKNKKQLSHMI